MNRLLLFLFLFLAQLSFAQVTVTSATIKTYYKTLKKVPWQYQRIDTMKGMSASLMILTVDEIDTLNKQDLIPLDKSLRIYSLVKDPITGKEIKTPMVFNKDTSTYLPFPCGLLLSNDTLKIQMSAVLFPYAQHTIINKNVTSVYEEYLKRDTIFKLKLTDKKSNSLSVPIYTPLFKLSSSVYKAGQTLYGEVEFVTEPYYVDDWSFKSGYIKKRLHCRYVFKGNIVDRSKPY